MSSISIAIAGSTERTVLCAEALRGDSRFTISWVLTPEPRPVGRTQTLTKNPVHAWAEKFDLKTILLNKKIDETVRAHIENTQAENALQQITTKPDFLLVVDFGYLIPTWLLAWPTKTALNIHPSDLPRWRGSSPGQFALLYGDTTSAVCLMEMSKGMDEGPILHREPFAVEQSWTQADYYEQSFALISPLLPDLISEVGLGNLHSTPQPEHSPTPVAQRLSKTDSFIEWTAVQAALSGQDATLTSQVLATARPAHASLAALISHAVRAFSPWPIVWTQVTTAAGMKRMQLLQAHAKDSFLVLEKVKIEGKAAASWATVEKTLV